MSFLKVDIDDLLKLPFTQRQQALHEVRSVAPWAARWLARSMLTDEAINRSASIKVAYDTMRYLVTTDPFQAKHIAEDLHEFCQAEPEYKFLKGPVDRLRTSDPVTIVLNKDAHRPAPPQTFAALQPAA